MILLYIFFVQLLVIIIFNSKQSLASSKWRDYSNQYFNIKYPAKWNKAEAGDRVGFAPVDSSTYFGFDIDVVPLENASFKNFQNRFKKKLKKLYGSASEVEVEEITIDGQPAYKIVVTNSEYQIKGLIISIYKNGIVFDFIFTGTEKEYLYYYNIFDEIIKDIKFNNFKVGKKIKMVKKRKLTRV